MLFCSGWSNDDEVLNLTSQTASLRSRGEQRRLDFAWLAIIHIGIPNCNLQLSIVAAFPPFLKDPAEENLSSWSHFAPAVSAAAPSFEPFFRALRFRPQSASSCSASSAWPRARSRPAAATLWSPCTPSAQSWRTRARVSWISFLSLKTSRRRPNFLFPWNFLLQKPRCKMPPEKGAVWHS